MKSLLCFVLIFVLPYFSAGLSIRITQTMQMPVVTKIIPIPVVSLTSIFDIEETDGVLQNGFRWPKDTLYLIDKNLEQVDMSKTDSQSARPDFKDHVSKVQTLAHFLNHLLEQDGSIIRDLSVRTCKQYLTSDTAGWIHREMMGKNFLQPIMEAVKGSSHEEDFLMWSNLIALTYMKAAILGDVCLSTVYANDTKLNETLESYRDETRQDLRDILGILRSEGRRHFERDIELGTVLKSHVVDYAKEHLNATHRDFAEGLQKNLANKFFWRSWVVVSYDLGADFPKEEYKFKLDDAVLLIGGDQFKRVVFVAPADPSEKVSEAQLDKCLQEHWVPPRECPENCGCKELLDEFGNCYEGRVKGVLCVHHRLGAVLNSGGSGAGFKSYPLHLYGSSEGATTNKTDSATWERAFDIIVVF